MTIEFAPETGLTINGADLAPFREVVTYQAGRMFADSPDGPQAQAIRALAGTEYGDDEMRITNPDLLATMYAPMEIIGKDPGFEGQARQEGLAAVMGGLIGGSAVAEEMGRQFRSPLSREALQVARRIADLLRPTPPQP